MQLRRATHALVVFAVLCGLRAAASAQTPAAPLAFGAETNYWPFYVGRAVPSQPHAAADSWSAVGPLFFKRPLDTTNRHDDGSALVRGLRPLFVEKRDTAGKLVRMHLLYPLFNWTRIKDGYRWDIFTLINHEHTPERNPRAGSTHENQFDIWPFYFSNRTNDPATTYHALFPIYGRNVHSRLLNDRTDWFLFPLYGRFQTDERVTTAVLWPFFRHTGGGDNRGFAFWPFFGWREKNSGENAYKERYYLWPFIFWHTENYRGSGSPARLAVLPFYYRETAAGLDARSYMLFFGYTRRTEPYVYSENRYLWPLFVQGRGPEHRVNRWAPFYTHSRHGEAEKTWVMWPLWKQARLDNGSQIYEKKQFLYFLYHSVSQKRSLPPGATPEQKTAHAARPPARKISLWPLYTYWTDGRGRKQLQALSPLDVFLPQNEPTRQIYAPFFALYKFEQAAPGHTRHAFLWDFITHRREPGVREFHVGPLYAGERVGGYKRRALFCGVLGLQKTPEKGWRPFAFKFKSLQKQLAAGASLATPASVAPAKGVASDAPAKWQPHAYPKVRTRR